MNNKLVEQLYEAIQKTIGETLDASEEAGFVVDEEVTEALNQSLRSTEMWEMWNE